MNKVFLSPILSNGSVNEIKRVLELHYNDYEIVNRFSKEVVLRIAPINEIFFILKRTCFTITPLCFSQMTERKINPFFMKDHKDIMINLFLQGKSIGFDGCSDKTIKDYSKKVKQMGGTVSKNPVFIVSESTKLNRASTHIVSIHWLDALLNSSHFIEPKQFYISESSKRQNPNRKKDPSKTCDDLRIRLIEKTPDIKTAFNRYENEIPKIQDEKLNEVNSPPGDPTKNKYSQSNLGFASEDDSDVVEIIVPKSKPNKLEHACSIIKGCVAKTGNTYLNCSLDDIMDFTQKDNNKIENEVLYKFSFKDQSPLNIGNQDPDRLISSLFLL